MYCIVDIETTGGSKDHAKITEIAIYRHDGNGIVDQFVSLINPESVIPEFISRMTGITNDMVRTAPKFYEVARQIVDITEGCIFVAHNVGFDYGFVQSEFASMGYDFVRPTLCTVKLARHFLPGHRSYSLGNLCQDLDIQINGRHRAGGDAYATVKLFEMLLEKNNGVISDENPYKKIDLSDLHPNLNLDKLRKLPAETGVYYMYNHHDIIYIGKSKNIKARVFNHLSSNTQVKGSRLRVEAEDVDYELTGSELIALLLESSKIKSLQPKYNKALRKKKSGYGIYSYFDQNHYQRLIIQPLSTQGDYFASFDTLENARQSLYKWIDQYGLCQKMSGLYEGKNGCFQYQLKQCNGACVGEETPENYNTRVQKLVDDMGFGIHNMVIIDKGRRADEFSVVYIEKGSYCGFGYIDREESIASPQDFRDFITSQEDNRDARMIIANYLKHHRPLKMLPF